MIQNICCLPLPVRTAAYPPLCLPERLVYVVHINIGLGLFLPNISSCRSHDKTNGILTRTTSDVALPGQSVEIRLALDNNRGMPLRKSS